MGRIPWLPSIGFLQLTSAVFRNRLRGCTACDGSKLADKLGGMSTLPGLAGD